MTMYTDKLVMLLERGYTIGQRDTRLNTNHPGAYMVVEPYSENKTPTQDARNGPWCVVGDDLSELVDEAWNNL